LRGVLQVGLHERAVGRGMTLPSTGCQEQADLRAAACPEAVA
jgi:hypothetical protein